MHSAVHRFLALLFIQGIGLGCFPAPDYQNRACSNRVCPAGLVCNARDLCVEPGEGSDGSDGPSGEGDAGAEPAEGPGHEKIADSVGDFSGTQGEKGWRYGSITPSKGKTFVELPMFAADKNVWQLSPGKSWVYISDRVVHPNGSVTSNNRDPVEQWAIRRWISSVEGDITISGHINKLSAGMYSNGVNGRILIDGHALWSTTIGGDDTRGVSFVVTTTISLGSTLDFVVEPNGNDYNDATVLTASIHR